MPVVPRVVATRCVHVAIKAASCSACVDVCPRGAWRLNDAALELDEGRCDGCGLCVPACPRQAIILSYEQGKRVVSGMTVCLAVCDQVSTKQGEGRMPCIHALGLTRLLRAYHEGLRVWLLAHADCAACPRGRAVTLYERVAHLNIMLRQRGLPAILARHVSARMGTDLLQSGSSPTMRRGFLRAMSRHPASALLGIEEASNPDEVEPVGALLPPGDDAMLPWIVRIEPGRCIGCHACARVCRDGAIEFDEETPAYQLRHRNCCGCGLCVDLCEHHALSIQAWAEPGPNKLMLVARRCRSCGVMFHLPHEHAVKPTQCWICARSSPAQRLYQVMD